MTSTNTQLLYELAQRFPVSEIAEAAIDTAIARSAKVIRDALEADGLPVIMVPSSDEGQTAIGRIPHTAVSSWPWGVCETAPEKALQIIGLAQIRRDSDRSYGESRGGRAVKVEASGRRAAAGLQRLELRNREDG